MITRTRGPYRGTKAVRLCHDLGEAIRSGRWPAGAFLPPETTLAVDYGVTRTTIRRSLDLLVRERVLRRIPHRGLVVLNGSGTELPVPPVRHRSRVQPSPRGRLCLAAICAAAPDEGMSQIQAGIEAFSREHGIDYQIIASNDDPDRPFAALEHVDDLGIQGVIILPYPGDLHRELLEGLHRKGFPLVCVERRAADLQVPSVEVDNRTGMYRAVQHLLSTSRRPVFYLGMHSSHKTDSDRYAGYAKAMADAGYGHLVEDHTVLHDMDTADPRYWHVDNPWLQGFEVAQRLFTRGERFWSIACQKDDIAWGCYRAASEHGLVVGKTCLITGFDDKPIAAQLDPPLTTVRQSFREKGYKAAWLLHRRLSGNLDAAVQITLPTELICRASA